MKGKANKCLRTWSSSKCCDVVGWFVIMLFNLRLSQTYCEYLNIHFRMAHTQVEKRDVDIIIISLILGTVAIPTYHAAVDDMTPNRIHSAMFLFAAGILGSGVATFIRSHLKGRSLIRSCQDALWSLLCFLVGGFIPFLVGTMIQNRVERIILLIVLTSLLIGLVLIIDFQLKNRSNQEPRVKSYYTTWGFTLVAIGGIVFFSDMSNQLSRKA